MNKQDLMDKISVGITLVLITICALCLAGGGMHFIMWVHEVIK